jgi:hypothetical protein
MNACAVAHVHSSLRSLAAAAAAAAAVAVLYVQVALKACHYACERHLYNEVLFCSLQVEPTSSDDSPKAMPGSAARARSDSLHSSNGNIAAVTDTARARAIAEAVFAEPADVCKALLGTPKQIEFKLINGIGEPAVSSAAHVKLMLCVRVCTSGCCALLRALASITHTQHCAAVVSNTVLTAV